MIQQKDNFAIFGLQFQTKALQSLFVDQEFFEKIYDILEKVYFDQRVHVRIYEMVLDYYEKYRIVPSLDNIEINIKANVDDETFREECLGVIKEIKKNPVSDLTYIKDKVFEFCKNQKMKKALLTSVDLLQQGKFDDIYRTIKDALNAGENSDLGQNYFEHFDKRLISANRDAIPTGWPVLDGILDGGFGRGELVVFLAGTSVGKSWLLAYSGKGALQNSKTVLHYTFELNEDRVGQRYDAIITNVPIKHIKERSDFVKDKLDLFRKSTGSKLYIKEYPTKKANIVTIRNHINKLLHWNIIPDIIMIDYADLMLSRKNYEQKRYEAESIYEDLRALASELKVPVVTASQTHRASIDDEVVTLASIAESYAKAQVSDIIISLSRRWEDKLRNTGKLFIAKNRAGQDGIVLPIIMNTTTAQIEVLPPQEVDPTKEFAVDQKVVEIYKKSQKNGKT